MADDKNTEGSVFLSRQFKMFELLSSLLIFGLAVYAALAGKVGVHELAWFATFIAVAVVRSPYLRQKAKDVKTRVDDRRELANVVVFSIGANILPVIYMATPLLGFADNPLPMWTLAPGAAFAALGVLMIKRGHADLDVNWSGVLELRKGHTLVTQGIYARTRNPIYLGFFLTNIAQMFFIGNWIAGLSGFLGFAFLYVRRIPREEGMMAEAFGAEWEAYKKAVPQLVPVPGRKAD